MELLIPQILREDGWDELQIWLNTTEPDDVSYIRGLPALDKRIRVVSLPDGMEPKGIGTIYRFFPNCIDEGTVYIRFDDDICYIEPGTIPKLAAFRIKQREPFVIYPVIINNALISHIFQVLGRIRAPKYLTTHCMDSMGWKDPKFAETMHRAFLSFLEKGDIERFKLPTRIVAGCRVSINCIAWLGEEFAKFGGVLGMPDEEEWLSVTRNTRQAGYNMIFGEVVVAHFAFYPQREYLDETDILERYRNVLGLEGREAASPALDSPG
ncbi:MAG: hypothetical protein R3E09_04915 [Novosphingobium sp.]|nr:hypothetical protein [Novosphingobium sp.]